MTGRYHAVMSPATQISIQDNAGRRASPIDLEFAALAKCRQTRLRASPNRRIASLTWCVYTM
jgi:hypothetical protein